MAALVRRRHPAYHRASVVDDRCECVASRSVDLPTSGTCLRQNSVDCVIGMCSILKREGAKGKSRARAYQVTFPSLKKHFELMNQYNIEPVRESQRIRRHQMHQEAHVRHFQHVESGSKSAAALGASYGSTLWRVIEKHLRIIGYCSGSDDCADSARWNDEGHCEVLVGKTKSVHWRIKDGSVQFEFSTVSFPLHKVPHLLARN